MTKHDATLTAAPPAVVVPKPKAVVVPQQKPSSHIIAGKGQNYPPEQMSRDSERKSSSAHKVI